MLSQAWPQDAYTREGSCRMSGLSAKLLLAGHIGAYLWLASMATCFSMRASSGAVG